MNNSLLLKLGAPGGCPVAYFRTVGYPYIASFFFSNDFIPLGQVRIVVLW